MDGAVRAAAGHVRARLREPGPTMGFTVMLTVDVWPVTTWVVALPDVMIVPAAFFPVAVTVHVPEVNTEIVAEVPAVTVVEKVAPLGPVPAIT
jgi:hypothetical protein